MSKYLHPSVISRENKYIKVVTVIYLVVPVPGTLYSYSSTIPLLAMTWKSRRGSGVLGSGVISPHLSFGGFPLICLQLLVHMKIHVK